MLSQQLVALFSLVVSHVAASPLFPQSAGAALGPIPDLAKDVTQLILKPDSELDKMPGINAQLKESIKARPDFYRSQLTAGNFLATHTFHDVTDNHGRDIQRAIQYYSAVQSNPEVDPEAKADLLELTGNNVYSRLCNLQQKYPEEFAWRIRDGKNLLSQQLHQFVTFTAQQHLVPMGRRADVVKWEQRIAEQLTLHGKAYHQQTQAALEHLPPAFPMNSFSYMTKDEVMKELRDLEEAYELEHAPHNKHTAIPNDTDEKKPLSPASPGQYRYVTPEHLNQALEGVKKQESADAFKKASVSPKISDELGKAAPTAHTPVGVTA